MTLLENYLNELKALQATDFHTYEENFLIHRAVERTLHLAVEACLDIGQHIIADQGMRTPHDNRDIFVVLAEEGILTAEQLPALEQMARFRNLIVHDYAQIDNAIVYRILQTGLPDFVAFAARISEYLGQQSSQ